MRCSSLFALGLLLSLRLSPSPAFAAEPDEQMLGATPQVEASVPSPSRAPVAGSLLDIRRSAALATVSQWPANGIPVVTGAGDQALGPNAIVSDGAGGAIVAWEALDAPNGYDIYAQHILSSGTVDPAWPAGGVALCTASGDQRTPMLCRDAANGALVTWSDTRAGTADIYVHHVLGSGVLDPAWPVSGIALCTASGDQLRPSIVGDGVGGGVVVWNDHRGSSYDIYAGHVHPWGVVDAGWPVDGRALCTATGDQYNNSCQAISDGVGGAIAVWEDLRTPANGVDIYMQRIQANGVVDPVWPVNGVAVVNTPGNQTSPFMADDGRVSPSKGAIVTWRDSRGSDMDTYVQHIQFTGTVAFGPNGLLVCNAPGEQVADGLLPDIDQGAIMVWRDYRDGPAPVLYARRILKTIQFDPAWPTTGLALGSPMSASTYSEPVAANDLLLLRCEGDLNGAGGESPNVDEGISYEAGHSGLGAYFGLGNQVRFDRTNNLGVTSGSIEFWIKPHWNGNDGQDHDVLVCGGAGGIMIQKDGGNFWRIILNRFGAGGNPEVGAGLFIPGWLANQWRFCAFTWDDNSVRVYVNGNLVAQSTPTAPLPAVSANDFQIGAEGSSLGALDAVLDGVRISSGVRTQTEIYNAYLTGLNLGAQGVAVGGDGAGGAIAVWSESGIGNDGVRAQHVRGSGDLSSAWSASGETVAGGGAPTQPVLAADGTGGAIVAWNDYRNSTDYDIYAQRLDADYLITASAGSHGSISPAGAVSVPSGGSQSYTFTPASSYFISDVQVDGVSVGTPSTYNFTNVSAAHTISATFATNINPIFETTDSLTVLQHGFDTPSGACALRGWIGQDRTGMVFSHVSTRFVQNGVTLFDGRVVNMGTKGLWVGADDTSAPDEVKNWVGDYGYGNDWSQRIVSPSFSTATYPNAKLTFDARIEQESNGPITTTIVPQTELFAVQGLQVSGKWTTLTSHFTTTTGPLVSKFVTGRGVFHCEMRTGEDGNQSLGLAANTRLRLVVQTSAFNSNEDGGVGLGQGAAVIDSLCIRNVADDAVISAPVDFEDGTTGAWTLDACNGNLAPAVVAIRDVPLPNAQPDVVSGFDFTDPSCVWTFTSPSGYMDAGTYIYLVSPWFPTYQNADGFLFSMEGKLGTPALNRRFIQVSARGKNVGDTRPRVVVRPTPISFFLATDDNSTPVSTFPAQYPAGFGTIYPTGASPYTDSTQIVIRLINRPETGYTGLPASRFPYIDDVEIDLLGADDDYDGVPNAVDACPTVNAAGQDANGDGCIDVSATMRHVESWAAGPIRYAISANGDPRITDGSDLDAVRAGFQVWEGVPGSSLDLQELPVSAAQNSSSLDGFNLVTFEDSHVSLPPNVLAVTPTTSLTRRQAYLDRIRLPGEIVDADLIFNREAKFSTPSHDAGPGSYDLRSVTAHEAGHFLGLSHSGVLDATMFFVLQPGQDAASLEDDDRAAIASAYPAATLATDYGTISGKVQRGVTLAAVPGALVTAVRLSGGEPVDTTSSDYSAEDGSFVLRRLPPGEYAVRVTPLDGEVGGFPLTPGYISARVEAVAQTDFEAEWWNTGESESDDLSTFTPITVTAGNVITNRDVITNVDVTPPTIATVDPVFPADGATQVRIDSAILVNFSERIQASTLQGNFKVHEAGNHPSIGGNGVLINGGRTYVFTPMPALQFNTDYDIELLGGIKDLRGVGFSPPFLSSFSTETRPTVAIADLQPRSASEGSFVTIVGAGFDPAVTNTVTFTFCPTCTPVAVTAGNVTPSSLVAKVPAGAATGGVAVTVGAETSNPFTFTVLPASAQIAPSLSDRINLPAGFSPTDVAIAPDGLTLYTVGEGGLATVNLDPGRPAFRTPVVVALPGARRLTLSADGYRAYVTRRDLSEVAVVDADPFSGQYRAVVAHVTVGDGQGRPEGVAVVSSGRRAYVTDAESGTIYEIDTAAGSLTLNQVLREITDPGWTLTGGVVALPGSSRLLFTTGNDGSRSYDLSSGAVSALASEPSTAAVAATPSGEEMLYLGAGPSTGSVLYAGQGGGPSQPGAISLGGTLRDIEVNPQGRSAFVTNAAFNQLQVIDVDPSSSTYHTKVAEAPTGRNPSAVALSADGSTIVVAEEGGSSLALFGTGASGQIVRLTPPTVVAGGAVSITFTPGFHPAGSQVMPGFDAPVAFSHLAPPAASAAAFIAPSNLQQDDRALTVLDSGGSRMLAASFRVVDSISGLAPQATGMDLALASTSCSPGAMDGRLLIRASHAGKLLAVGRFGACDVRLEVHRISAGAGETFGERLASTVLPASPTAISDLAFTPDDRKLWFCLDGALYAMDADPASPGFGVASAISGLTGGQLAHAVTADPMGRYMIVGMSNGDLTFWNPLTHALLTTVSTPAAIASLATSPDGRYGIAGSADQALIFTLDTPALAATTAAHSGAGNVKSMVVTSDARYAVGLFENDHLGVWDLATDPGFTETYVDLTSYGFTGATEVVPEPEAGSVMVGSAASASLLHLPLGPGTVATVPLPLQARTLARSLDGRQLWIGDWEGGPASSVVSLFSLSHASAMALVSGADQAAPPGNTLPNPIRVRLVDSQANPQVGVVVHFDASQGTLDGQGGTVRRITDVNGEAQALWTLPSSPGSATVTATALGVAGGVLSIPAEAAASDQQITPQVTEFGPQTGATGINIGSTLLIRFNQRMNKASVTSKLSFTVAGLPATFDPTFDDDGRFVSIQPQQPLPFGATCVLSLAAGALDTDGQATPSTASTSFTTQAQPALALASVYPPSAKVGDQVVLTGRGFSLVPAQDVVLFNDVLANVTTSSFEELRVNVPTGATTGAVRVTLGSVTSNPANFIVTQPAPLMQAEGTVPLRRGVRHIAVTPDGQRAYVTNPLLSTVTVLTLNPAAPLTTITVGLSPQGIAITPDGTRAYVANTGSNDVSVIDIDPVSPSYHQVVDRIPVAPQPTDVAISVIGPQVLVVSADEEGTASFIDADPGDGAYHRVTAKTKTGSGGTSVAISADGTRAFVLTVGGELVVMDLAPGSPTRNQVTSKTRTGTGGTSVAITADGTILLVLLRSGELLAVDVTPGSPTENQVVSKTKTGSGGTGVAISADGGTAFVSNGIDVLRFLIQLGSGGSGSTLVPGPTVSLVEEGTMTVGDAPAGVVFDPHNKQAFVANEGSGTVTVLAAPGFTAVPLPSPAAPAVALQWAGASPARGEARLRFALPLAAEVRLEILDIEGRRVRVLLQGRQTAGWHVVKWNGVSDAGEHAASGVYFVRLASDRTRLHLKMVWLR